MRALSARVQSFVFALRGLRRLFAEPNVRLHALATLVVLALGYALGVSREDWLWLGAAIAAVWIAEAFNTALELVCNAAVPERHPLVGQAKDVAAAAVLIAALFSLVVAALVFGPHVPPLLGP